MLDLLHSCLMGEKSLETLNSHVGLHVDLFLVMENSYQIHNKTLLAVARLTDLNEFIFRLVNPIGELTQMNE